MTASVWPVGQQAGRTQRRGRYLAESTAHPGKMLPALARAAIERFTQPGDVVHDPMCGIGTTLVEAAYLGRDSFGIEYEPRWATLARGNLALARSQGATGDGEVVVGDCRHLDGLVPRELIGGVALMVTSPPYGPVTHGRLGHDGERVRKVDGTYSTDRANLANAGLDSLMSATRTMLVAAGRVLRERGVVVLTARTWRRDGALIDWPGEITRLGTDAGLKFLHRDVALLAGLRDNQLVPRSSFFHLKEVRTARERGRPYVVVAHEDVIVFGKPS